MKKLILFLMVGLFYCQNEIPTALPCGSVTITNALSVSADPCQTSGELPGVPQGLKVVTGNGKIDISWEPCTKADSYIVYYSDVSGVYSKKVNNAVSPQTITLNNDTKYYFKITSLNQYGSADSVEVSAIPGVIDNFDGTVSIVTTGLTWSKCSQKDAAGNDTYNFLNNDCSNGVPGKLFYCSVRYTCDNGTTLNGTGSSEVYASCQAKGMRVPSADELLTIKPYYSKDMWPDMVNDNYYPNNGWASPQPYGGYVWVNIIGGSFSSANFVDPSLFPAYVLCVR